MAIDVSSPGALRRRLDLQERLWKAAHPRVTQGAPAGQLHREIRSYLLKASDQGILRTSPAEIYKMLLCVGPDRNGHVDIAIGERRNFDRRKDLPHLTRRDGGWFDFQLFVHEEAGRSEVIAYDFELRLPPGSGLDFVRFDLNPPGHGNEDDGLRSHFHLNADDDGLAAPAAVMSPFEILDLFLHGLRRVGRIRRAPTQED